MGRIGGTNSAEKPQRQEGPQPAPVLAEESVTHVPHFVPVGAKVDPFTSCAEQKLDDPELDPSVALVGLTTRLRRDTVVILRLDGEDLEEFVAGPELEEVIAAAYPLQGSAASLKERVRAALGLLTVDHGMPPSSDRWVVENILEPAMGITSAKLLEQPVSVEAFAIIFRKIVEGVAQRLKEHPALVACYDDTFDGSDINWLLSAKHDMDKLLTSAWRTIAKEKGQLTPKEFLNNVLDKILVFAGLPSYGTESQLNAIIDEAYKEVKGDDVKFGSKGDFDNMMKGILRNIMHKLEKNPVSISSTTVVNEHSCQKLC